MRSRSYRVLKNERFFFLRIFPPSFLVREDPNHLPMRNVVRIDQQLIDKRVVLSIFE